MTQNNRVTFCSVFRAWFVSIDDLHAPLLLVQRVEDLVETRVALLIVHERHELLQGDGAFFRATQGGKRTGRVSPFKSDIIIIV